MRSVLTIFCVLCVSGCDSFRVFQSKVPTPVVKAESQLESERRAADLIARTIETPVELKPVAVTLSASLGTPLKSLVTPTNFSLPLVARTADSDLRTGIATLQTQLTETNRRLTLLQNKPIEGTGISLLGPGMATIVIGLIVLGVVFPPAFTLLFMLFKRLRATTGKIVTAIDNASDTHENNPAVTSIKTELASVMDRVEKQVVHTLQKP